jgi:hypothetical protein
MDDGDVARRLAALPSPPLPDAVAAAVADRLAEERKVVPITARHRRRLNWLLGAAAAGALVMLVTVGDDDQPAPLTEKPLVRAGAVFDAGPFADQVRTRFLSGANGAAATETFVDSPSAMTACMTAIHAYGKVLAADVGTYDTALAVVLVTAYPPNTDYEEVWVVGPRCGAGDVTVVRHMIYDVDHSTAL